MVGVETKIERLPKELAERGFVDDPNSTLNEVCCYLKVTECAGITVFKRDWTGYITYIDGGDRENSFHLCAPAAIEDALPVIDAVIPLLKLAASIRSVER
jgi:hypothetical protein